MKDISIDSLRHYDKINLLKPHFIDKKTGYRYYSSKQFFKVDIIKFCKNLDIPLSDIKILFENSNQEIFKNFLDLQRKEINLKIKKYNEMIFQIDNMSNRFSEYNIAKKEKTFYYKFIPERKIVYLDYEGPSIGNDSILAYSKLHNFIMNSKLDLTYNGGFIYTFDNNKIFNKCIFESVKDFQSNLQISNEILPSGTYLCISYRDNELDKVLSLLLNEIESRKIKSPHIINNYLLDGEFHSNTIINELQILIPDDTIHIINS